jgi:hypothetical protein
MWALPQEVPERGLQDLPLAPFLTRRRPGRIPALSNLSDLPEPLMELIFRYLRQEPSGNGLRDLDQEPGSLPGSRKGAFYVLSQPTPMRQRAFQRVGLQPTLVVRTAHSESPPPHSCRGTYCIFWV